MKKLLILILAACGLSSATAVFASTPILDALKGQGVVAQAIGDMELGEIKGAALIYGQPYPSVTAGKKEHFVTYKGWGSYSDYNAYNYIGNGYDPSAVLYYSYGGSYYRVAGDQWLADLYSSPYTWNRANSQVIDQHFQVLDPNTLAPTAYAFRDSAWNRPITTFSW